MHLTIANLIPNLDPPVSRLRVRQTSLTATKDSSVLAVSRTPLLAVPLVQTTAL